MTLIQVVPRSMVLVECLKVCQFCQKSNSYLLSFFLSISHSIYIYIDIYMNIHREKLVEEETVFDNCIIKRAPVSFPSVVQLFI